MPPRMKQVHTVTHCHMVKHYREPKVHRRGRPLNGLLSRLVYCVCRCDCNHGEGSRHNVGCAYSRSRDLLPFPRDVPGKTFSVSIFYALESAAQFRFDCAPRFSQYFIKATPLLRLPPPLCGFLASSHFGISLEFGYRLWDLSLPFFSLPTHYPECTAG